MRKAYGAFIAWLIAFTIMAYRTEKVYWYTGVSFETAVQVGRSRCKAYAPAHLKRFTLSGAVCLLYAAVAVFLGLPWWLDLVVCFAAEVGTAISTLHIKL